MPRRREELLCLVLLKTQAEGNRQSPCFQVTLLHRDLGALGYVTCSWQLSLGTMSPTKPPDWKRKAQETMKSSVSRQRGCCWTWLSAPQRQPLLGWMQVSKVSCEEPQHSGPRVWLYLSSSSSSATALCYASGLQQHVVLRPVSSLCSPAWRQLLFLPPQAARKGARAASLAVHRVSFLISPAALGRSVHDRWQRSLPWSQVEVLHRGEALMHLPSGELKL